MKEILLAIYRRCRTHARKCGVPTLRVLVDYLWARVAYGFCSEDYFHNTQGYAMKNFQRRHFLSHRRWLGMMSVLNDASYTGILQDKKRTLEHFSKFIHREHLCVAADNYGEFCAFMQRHGSVLVKPLNEEGGKGIFKFTPPPPRLQKSLKRA